jgi:hypothetical protein
MAGGYIPGPDSVFSEWARNFVSYIGPHAAHLGFDPADLDELTSTKMIWEGTLLDHTQAQAAAVAARVQKDEVRATYEGIIRALAARIQAWPDTTDADRAGLGITIRSTAMVPTADTPPADRPVAFIDIGQRRKHTLRVANSTSMGATKAKPSWAFGCEVWRKVGEVPTGDGDIEYVGVWTRSPFLVDYPTEDAGKSVHYMLRWVSKKGKTGGWSETESATIAA